MTDEARLQRWLNGQRRSHQRTFQSRELVWQSFETLARDQGASIDQLIGEAMESYAAARGYQIPEEPPEENRWAAPAMHERGDPLEETHDAPELSPLDRSYMPPERAAPPPPPMQNRKNPFSGGAGWDDENDLARTETRQAAFRGGGLPARPPIDDIREPGDESRTSPRYGRTGATLAASPAPIPAAIQRPVPTPAVGTMANRGGTRPLAPPGARAPTPPPQQVAQPPPPMPIPRGRDPGTSPGTKGTSTGGAKRLTESGSNPSVAKRLILAHRGETVEVDKDRFLLGRSKTQADMRLEDPNVSRQHAVIERVGSAYYIVDLGSTNGVYVGGERVTRRALADGDLITITSHEIRCALR